MLRKKGQRKAQGGVIVLVLLILIGIIIIAIVWNIIVPLIKEQSEDIQFGQFSVNLEVQNIILFENGVVRVVVSRGAGDFELEGLKFVFTDAEGRAVTRDDVAIDELNTKTYYFSPIIGIGEIEKVDVAPIVNGNLGMPTQTELGSVLEVPSGVISLWRFDDLSDSIGENHCTGGVVSGGSLSSGENISCGSEDNSLDLSNEMAINFWIRGDVDQMILRKAGAYEISLEGGKIKFNDLNVEAGFSEFPINDGWNHVVISLAEISKIYLNNWENLILPIPSLVSGTGNLEIFGEIDDVMVFDKPLQRDAVEGLYNNQVK